ncbi:MAG: hypothetical protein ACI9VR_001797 [Cognaticolwellia sp.]|jgi:hypothetical protein
MTLACATATPGASPPQDLVPSAHPYAIEELPETDLAALTRSLENSLGQVMALHPDPVLASYQAALAYGGEDCPGVDTLSQDGTTTSHWQGICYNPDNQAWLNGPMTTWQWTQGYMDAQTLPAYDDLYQRLEPMRELRWDGQGLNGQTDIVADGVDFNCSCLAISGRAQDSETAHAFVSMDGPSHWSGPQAEGTWMEREIQVKLSGFASLRETQRALLLMGNISGLDDEFGSIGFELSVQVEAGQCAHWNTTEQRIWARQSSTGHWIHMDLPEFQAQSCVVCTEGDALCVDLFHLLDWEVLPW